MSYEESELLSLLTKQEIDRLFLRANSYLCQVKFLLEEKEQLQQESEQLKEQLLVAQTNEETFRLEMEDITKTLGLDENTLFDDVKVCVKSLKDNWNKLKEQINNSGKVFRNRCYDLVCDIDEVPKEQLTDFVTYLAYESMEALIKKVELEGSEN